MKATTIIIGDEILLGRVTDTNSGFIARQLDPLGIETERVITVGDNGAAIEEAVRTALEHTDLVITTGGLGPTKDDITTKVMLGVFGGEMTFDEAVYANVAAQFERRGLAMNRLTREQAMVPSSAHIVQNELGTAPIMWFERNGKVLITMPGVPTETCGMMERAVTALIARRFKRGETFMHSTFITTGMSESGLAEMLEQWEDTLPDGFHLAYLPDSPVIRLRLDGSGRDREQTAKTMERLSDELKALLGDLLIADREAGVAELALDALREKGWTLGTAESCTGGNIAHAVTSVAGSSDCFEGSVVSYSNRVKHGVLGVSLETLDAFGAVSRETVGEMLEGACRTLGTDCAIATSGIAGPGGGSAEKPVGTVWIGVKTPERTVINVHHMPGDRSRVIARTTATALLVLLKAIKGTRQ